MAKKYKRNVSQSTRTAEVFSQPSQAPATSGRRAQAEFNPDYTYIIKDLKRIGVLAGSFFIILIALSFILN